MLGSLAFFRNQDPGSSLVSFSPDILGVDARWPFFVEAISVPSSVVDELLRQKNVPWFGEGLAATTTMSEISGCSTPSKAGLSFQKPLWAPILICKLYPEAKSWALSPSAARNSLPGLRSAKTK